MSLADIISPFTSIARFALSLLGKNQVSHLKHLEARLILRGIVSELPEDISFYICDEDGVRHKGVYVIGLLIWNKGNLPITSSDFISTAPLQVKLNKDCNLVNARIIPAEDQTVSSFTMNQNTLTLTFDCINPHEYLVIPIFVTGNANTDVQVTGRIIGQEIPIDHTAEDVRASLGERFSVLALLILLFNSIPGFFIGGWIILRDYGLEVVKNNPDKIPAYLTLPFFMGLMVITMYVFARTAQWLERRKYPKGYPLYSDLEPPLPENVRGMLRTLFRAKKQRVSLSMFDWGKPILMPSKKVKRRSVDDWVQ